MPRRLLDAAILFRQGEEEIRPDSPHLFEQDSS